MSDNDLHDLEPEEAFEMYLTEREKTDDLADATLSSLRSRGKAFVEWCHENDVDSLAELDGMTLHRWRLETSDGIAKRTLQSRLCTIQNFLRWARSVNAVPSELPETIDIPNVESPRDEYLGFDKAESVLNYLRKFDYASRDHVVMILLWRTGMRRGTLHSVDVDDYDSDNHCVELVHRPETDTPLKNKERGERVVALSEDTCTVLDDYIEYNRDDVTDEHGREPLLTTVYGRLSGSTIRRTVCRVTRPCVYAGECPVDREMDTCEAAQKADEACQCPEAITTHDVRRGALTNMLRNDVPKQVVSDRSDVTPEVLDKHYNQMTEREKMEKRREYLGNL